MRYLRAVVLIAGVVYAAASMAFSTAGWTCNGNCGTSGANGVVSLSPFAGTTSYGWVSSASGSNGYGLPGIGGSGNATNGSRIRSGVFAGSAGQTLSFYFNYVTSDGAGYADYAWARLLDSGGNEVALLFTARTTTAANTVPGFSMPAPTATLVPPNTPIVPGGPSWSPLGGSSGSCYATGCGYTGWVQANYTLPSSGNFILEFGVVNWSDTAYDSGLAFDGATVGGVPIAPGPGPDNGVSVPTLSEWAKYALALLLMMVGGLYLRKGKGRR